MEENLMFSILNLRPKGKALRAIGRGALACTLTVGMCLMVFAMPAQAANDNAVPAYQPPATSLINTGTTPNLTAEQPAPAPRWTLLPEGFAQPATSGNSSTTAPAFSYAATTPAAATLALAPEPSMNMNMSDTNGGHGHWLAPVIAGGILAGIGTYITIRAHNANCSSIGSSEGQTICGGIKTGGLVMIPVGGALVALGVWMRLRH
jgi:hypothetical protein